MRWKPPTLTHFKLNFDGSTRGGGVLQDRNGDALLVYLGKVGNRSNNLAKTMALLWGL